MKSSPLQSGRRVSDSSLSKMEGLFPPEQLPLYSKEAPIPGSLNDESIVRGIVTNAIKNCTKSREIIAEEMSELVGDRITVRMLNSYTSEAAEQHRWPAQYTRAFCHVVENWLLLRCITERSGFHLISDEEIELLDLGRQYLKRKAADERITILEAKLHRRGL